MLLLFKLPLFNNKVVNFISVSVLLNLTSHLIYLYCLTASILCRLHSILHTAKSMQVRIAPWVTLV